MNTERAEPKKILQTKHRKLHRNWIEMDFVCKHHSYDFKSMSEVKKCEKCQNHTSARLYWVSQVLSQFRISSINIFERIKRWRCNGTYSTDRLWRLKSKKNQNNPKNLNEFSRPFQNQQIWFQSFANQRFWITFGTLKFENRISSSSFGRSNIWGFQWNSHISMEKRYIVQAKYRSRKFDGTGRNM